MKKTITIIATLAGIALLSGCSLYGSVPTSTPNNSPVQSTPVSGNAVSIQNFSFSPAALTVAKGTTVTWTNNDSVPHQIKSATFNSAQLGRGQSFSFTFTETGTFDYSCGIHPSMLGKIIVQ